MRGSSSMNRTSRLSRAVSFGLNMFPPHLAQLGSASRGAGPSHGACQLGKGFRISGRYREVSFNALNAGRRPGGGFGDVRLVQRVHLSIELNLAVGHCDRDAVGVEIRVALERVSDLVLHADG